MASRPGKGLAAALLVAAGVLSGAPALSTPALARDAQADAFRALVKDVAPAVVVVKFTLKVTGGGEDRDVEREIPGLIIEGDGLVLVNNTYTGGFTEAERSMLPPGVSLSPTNIKVLIGDDTEGVDGKLIARDGEVNLAWIKLDKAPAQTLAVVDFTKGVEPKVGDVLLGLERVSKYFGREVVVFSSRVGATLKSPRPLFASSEQMGQATLTVPVFSEKGEPVGVTILQQPGAEEREAEQGVEARRGVMILPAAQIAEATKRAKEFAASGKPVDPPPPPAPAGPEMPADAAPGMTPPADPATPAPAPSPATPAKP